MSNLREKLSAEVGTATWEILDPHYRRDALFLVDRQLDLIDVAVGVAEDRVAEVESWLGAGSLVRPSPKQVEAWSSPDDTEFRFVIVQPYVLAQQLEP